MTRAGLRAAARKILKAGLSAIEPGCLVRLNLAVKSSHIHAGRFQVRNPKRVFVVSVGKAAVPMARAVHRILGSRLTAAIVIAPSRAPRMARTRSFVAAHPVPDQRGIRAAKQVIQMLEQAESGDLVLLLLSGGASALMPAPVEGVSLRDKQELTRLLLRRGATIAEMNAVRKRLSRLKGGGFLRLAEPARVLTLALSDVPGDDVATIGSGPTVPDPKAASLARRTVRKFLRPNELSPAVSAALDGPARQKAATDGGGVLVIGSGRTFARAAAKKAREAGFRTRILPEALRGEARECGPRLVKQFATWRRREPACLIATGETVVKVRGKGRGGRNQELALASIPALGGLDRPTVLAALATDGRDGASSASGGIVDDRTGSLARARGVSIESALERNDSSRALRRLGALLQTGLSSTNVADITLLLG